MLQYLGGRRQESRTSVLQPAMHPHVPPPPAPRARQCCHFTPKTEISPFCDDPKSKWPKIMMWRDAGGGGGGSAPPGLECRMQEQCSQGAFCPRSDASHLLGALTSQPCFSGRGPGVAEHGTSRAVGAEGTVLRCLLPQQVPGSLWGSPSLELQPSWPRNGTALPAQGSPGRILKPLGGRDLVPLPLPSLPLSVMQRALSTEPLGQQVHVPTAPHSWRKPTPPTARAAPWADI